MDDSSIDGGSSPRADSSLRRLLQHEGRGSSLHGRSRCSVLAFPLCVEQQHGGGVEFGG